MKKWRQAVITVSFYSMFKDNLDGILRARYSNSHKYYSNYLEQVQQDITEYTKNVLKPVLDDLAAEDEYLDFRKSSKLSQEDKIENYRVCLNYALDIICQMIGATLSKMEGNPFITFLCKKNRRKKPNF